MVDPHDDRYAPCRYCASTLTFQTEFFASYGYIVVAIGHRGTDGRIRFPDGYVYD